MFSTQHAVWLWSPWRAGGESAWMPRNEDLGSRRKPPRVPSLYGSTAQHRSVEVSRRTSSSASCTVPMAFGGGSHARIWITWLMMISFGRPIRSADSKRRYCAVHRIPCATRRPIAIMSIHQLRRPLSYCLCIFFEFSARLARHQSPVGTEVAIYPVVDKS